MTTTKRTIETARIGAAHIARLQADGSREYVANGGASASTEGDYRVTIYRPANGTGRVECRCQRPNGQPCPARRFHRQRICKHMREALTAKALDLLYPNG